MNKLAADISQQGHIVISAGTRERTLSNAIKRGMDLVLGSILLVVTLPVLVIFSVLIRLESKGCALYRQERAGLNGKPFTLLKLRSMYQDAEADGARWADHRDTRITRVGAIMRPLRIDELPQLVNILRGEMSLVGPRPERPIFIELLETEIPFYHLRTDDVKPGLTGLAQVKYTYGASIEDARMKLVYDLAYAKNRSFLLDLRILASTVRVVLFRQGAR